MSPAPDILDSVAAETSAMRRPGAIVIDWERRGKHARQRSARQLFGSDTSISTDDSDTLRRTRTRWSGPLVCRTNPIDEVALDDLGRAADLGADGALIPMVRTLDDIERLIAAGHDRNIEVGAMIETTDALDILDGLATTALDFAYIGLMDLAIERGTRSIFEPIRDGTLDRVAEALRDVPFGVGGLTRPGRGVPIPSELLAGEIARLGASFSFMRRSFHADLDGDQPGSVIEEIRGELGRIERRTADEVAGDRATLLTILADLDRRPIADAT